MWKYYVFYVTIIECLEIEFNNKTAELVLPTTKKLSFQFFNRSILLSSVDIPQNFRRQNINPANQYYGVSENFQKLIIEKNLKIINQTNISYSYQLSIEWKIAISVTFSVIITLSLVVSIWYLYFCFQNKFRCRTIMPLYDLNVSGFNLNIVEPYTVQSTASTSVENTNLIESNICESSKSSRRNDLNKCEICGTKLFTTPGLKQHITKMHRNNK